MNNVYSFSRGFKNISSVITIILAIIVLLTIGSFLLKLSFYLIPIVLLIGGTYKVYNKIKRYLSSVYKNKRNDNGPVQVADSIQVIQRAIENNQVIDVEYKQL